MKEQCWVVIYRSLSDLSKTLPDLRGGQSQTSSDISRDEPNVAGSERRRARSLPDLGRNDLSFKCLPIESNDSSFGRGNLPLNPLEYVESLKPSIIC